MDKVRESELLSAYLDGELTAAERAQVDQLLAADPTARQWVEEFRALGKTLQSLPREKLGEDFAPRVLELAQRRILAQTPREPPQAQPAEPPQPAWRNTVRGMFSRRALLWSGLAVAIAVMMMIWNPPPENRRIAVAPPRARPKSPESSAAKPAERSGPLTIQSPAELRRAAAAPAPLSPAAPARPAYAGAHGAPARAKSPSALGAANVAKAMEKAGEGGGGGVSPPPAADREAGAFQFSGMKPGKVAAPKKPGAGPSEAGAGGQTEPLRQQDQTQKNVNESAQQEPGVEQRTNQSFLDKANVQVPSDASLGQSGERSRQTNAAAEKQRVPGRALSFGGGGPTQGILVVYCEVTPEAANRHAFNSLLSRNGMRPTSPEAEVSRRSAKGGAVRKPEQVYVDATIPQIEALLDQLAAHRDAFPAISVQPAKGVDWMTDIVQHNSVAKGAAAAAKAAGQSLAGSAAAANEPQPLAEKNATTAKAAMAPSAPPLSAMPKPPQAKRGANRRDAAADDLMAGGTAHVHRVLFVFRALDDASPNRGVDDVSPKHGGR